MRPHRCQSHRLQIGPDAHVPTRPPSPPSGTLSPSWCGKPRPPPSTTAVSPTEPNTKHRCRSTDACRSTRAPPPPLPHSSGRLHGASHRPKTPRSPTAARTRTAGLTMCRNPVRRSHTPNTSPSCSPALAPRPRIAKRAPCTNRPRPYMNDRCFCHPIQDSLELHPVPSLRVDGCFAIPSSQSSERGALPLYKPPEPLPHTSKSGFIYPQILLKSRIFNSIARLCS